MKDACIHCQGELMRRSVSHTVTRKDYHLIIDAVPAWVCEQCGEPLFDEHTVNAIQDMLREVDNQHQKLSAPAVVT